MSYVPRKIGDTFCSTARIRFGFTLRIVTCGSQTLTEVTASGSRWHNMNVVEPIQRRCKPSRVGNIKGTSKVLSNLLRN